MHGNEPVTPLDETLRALDDLVRHELVRYIGCSNLAAWRSSSRSGISDHRGCARFQTCRPTTRSPAATWSARSPR